MFALLKLYPLFRLSYINFILISLTNHNQRINSNNLTHLFIPLHMLSPVYIRKYFVSENSASFCVLPLSHSTWTISEIYDIKLNVCQKQLHLVFCARFNILLVWIFQWLLFSVGTHIVVRCFTLALNMYSCKGTGDRFNTRYFRNVPSIHGNFGNFCFHFPPTLYNN